MAVVSPIRLPSLLHIGIWAQSQSNFQKLAVCRQMCSCSCLQPLPTNFAQPTSFSWGQEILRVGEVRLVGRRGAPACAACRLGAHWRGGGSRTSPTVCPCCAGRCSSHALSPSFPYLASLPFLLINISFDFSWIKRTHQSPGGA